MSMEFVIINTFIMIQYGNFLAQNSNVILVINFKMPTAVGILKFMTGAIFMFPRVEHDKTITLGPVSIAHIQCVCPGP